MRAQYDYSERVISSSQGPLTTQQTQGKIIHALSGIRTLNPRYLTALDRTVIAVLYSCLPGQFNAELPGHILPATHSCVAHGDIRNEETPFNPFTVYVEIECRNNSTIFRENYGRKLNIYTKLYVRLFFLHFAYRIFCCPLAGEILSKLLSGRACTHT
jgi:hypothetical protein